VVRGEVSPTLQAAASGRPDNRVRGQNNQITRKLSDPYRQEPVGGRCLKTEGSANLAKIFPPI